MLKILLKGLSPLESNVLLFKLVKNKPLLYINTLIDFNSLFNLIINIRLYYRLTYKARASR